MLGIGTNGGSTDRTTLYGSGEDLRKIKTVLVTCFNAKKPLFFRPSDFQGKTGFGPLGRLSIPDRRLLPTEGGLALSDIQHIHSQ